LPIGFFDPSFEEIFDDELKILASADTCSIDNEDGVIRPIIDAGGVSPTFNSSARKY